MFSGIIENFAKVKEFKKKGDYLLKLSTNFKIKDIKKGSSIACNGVCLTAHTIKKNGRFSGTCASQSPFLNKEGESCSLCRAKPEEKCKNEEA